MNTEDDFTKLHPMPVWRRGMNFRKFQSKCAAYNKGRKFHGLPPVDFTEKAKANEKYVHVVSNFSTRSADMAILRLVLKKEHLPNNRRKT